MFTGLSHDVIVHEMTHAVLDGNRACFLEQTNRDVAAFHEGFADLAALFRHFAHREVLLDTLQRTGGRLYEYQLRPDAVSDGGAAPARVARPGAPAQIAIEVDGKTTKAEDHRELPKRIAGTLKPGPLWIDYLL